MKIQFITRVCSARNRVTKQAKLVNIYTVKLRGNFSIISKYEELNTIIK